MADAVAAAEGVAASAIDAAGGMSAADLDMLAGPPQGGSSKPGQYWYWITQPRPKAETVERLGLKTLRHFTREEFTKLLVDVHAECNVLWLQPLLDSAEVLLEAITYSSPR